MHAALQPFHPVIASWFEKRVGIPTPPQVAGWPLIAAGKSALILAPTGSGKTLAAFLAAIDWLARRLLEADSGGGGTLWGVQILYVSPLKSLANDVQKNLLRPLEELAEEAAGMKRAWPEMTVALRTGDTPQSQRAAIVKRPPHILITTPESLNLMLTSSARTVLATARFVIVDEVHALAGSKRGTFLSLLLERLEAERAALESGKGGRRLKIAPGVYVPTQPAGPLVRIGLSATARPEELIARWLAGYDDAGNARAIEIVPAGQRKRLDIGVVCPFSATDDEEEAAVDPEEKKRRPVGHWREVTRSVLQMIRDHRSTLVFGNSRRLVERLAAKFQDELMAEAEYQEKHPEQALPKAPVILPHHGSIAREVRLETEQKLKRGEVDAVLATSSLELGIDVGALDLVIQVDSPGNVASALQRVGRAGHLEKATAKGRLLARGLGELPGFGALVPLMYAGQVEETRIPQNPLDVLAQQVVAACVPRSWKRGDLFRIFRRAMPYATLTEKQFDNVVAMLSKRAERVTSQGLRPRITWDRVNDELILMPGAGKVVMVNSGVISDTGQFPVFLIGATRGKIDTSDSAPSPREEATAGPGVRLGELDEEFVYETKEGDRVVLGSQVWRVVRIDADRVLVEPAAPGASRMPFWRGEAAPRSELLGAAVAQFHGDMEAHLNERGDDATREWLIRERHFDDQAADNAVAFYRRQLAAGSVPTQARVVVEHFPDRTGEPIIAILTPYGSRVNYALRLALETQFAARRLPAQLVHHDDGILIRPPVEAGEIPENPLAWLRSGTFEAEIADTLEATALFGLRFRQNAARALMLPRMTVTQRTPLWQQRLRARHLLALVKKQRNFPIILETYREILQDVLGIERVRELLAGIESGAVTVLATRNAQPSPFARSLYAQFTQTYLYAWDDPLVQSEVEPTVDQQLLDDILQKRSAAGADAAAVEPTPWSEADEATLQRRITAADYPARTAEELLEKIEATGAMGVPIESVGDAAWSEWTTTSAAETAAFLRELSTRRRVLSVEWTPGVHRWIAAENLAPLLAARKERPGLRQWTGNEFVEVAYSGLPAAILESGLTRHEARRLLVEQALRRVPATSRDGIAAELSWMAPEVAAILDDLGREGFLHELADRRIAWTEYVEQLRHIALRRQRRAAAAADVSALQRHLLAWQHVGAEGVSVERAVDRLEDVLDQFAGVPLPLSTWELEVLPLRVPTFTPAMLDGVCRSGHRVWVGSRDGSETGIAFWPRHLLGARPAPAEAAALSENAQRILAFLRNRGASFFLDLQIDVALEDGELAAALLELAAGGLVSNDQLEGLRDIERLADNGRRDGNGHVVGGARRSASARPRMKAGWWKTRESSATLGGRWFELPPPRMPGSATELAEAAADRVDRLLRRHAFACRELLEPVLDGSWRDCYDVLTRMEWAGSVRRGYFVEGITGSQFTLPGVRLEGAHGAGTGRESAVLWISMLDPANVWARLNTRWLADSGEAARIPRTAGSWIALVEGRPVLAATSYGQRLIPLPAPWSSHELALRGLPALLQRLPRPQRSHLEVRQWNNSDIHPSPAAEVLRQAGFTLTPGGLRLYRTYTPAVPAS